MAYFDAIVADAPLHYWRPALYPYGSLWVPDFGSLPNPVTFVSGNTFEGMSGVAADGVSVGAFSTASELASEGSEAPTTPFSLECWVFQRADGAGSSKCPFAWDGVLANSTFLVVRTGGDIQFTSKGIDCVSPTTFARGVWHHLVGTADGTNIRLYVDGALKQTIASGAIALAARQFFLLSASGVTVPFKGWIAEPAVYNATLNATQIAAHYAAAENKGIPPTPLLTVAPSGGVSPIATVQADLTDVLNSVRKTF